MGGWVVAGGDAKYLDDYTWTAWFPAKHPEVTITYRSGEHYKVKGPGSYRWYHGLYCAFGPARHA